MKDWWIKSGCFLTGYNYSIVSSTSEVVAKTVKKYTSALIIMCILWAFIGYCFTTRYIKGNTWQAIIGALILIILVIQIERQIILALNKNKLLFIFRGTIALMMAIIGSIIIDQILFKEDIEQKKILVLQNKVNEVYGFRAAELKRQIAEIDSTIFKKESDVNVLNEDLAKNPTTKVVTTQRTNIPVPTTMLDSTGTSNIIRTLPQTSVTVTTIPNPKQELITPINDQIKYLRDQKKTKGFSSAPTQSELRTRYQLKSGLFGRAGYHEKTANRFQRSANCMDNMVLTITRIGITNYVQ